MKTAIQNKIGKMGPTLLGPLVYQKLAEMFGTEDTGDISKYVIKFDVKMYYCVTCINLNFLYEIIKWGEVRYLDIFSYSS